MKSIKLLYVVIIAVVVAVVAFFGGTQYQKMQRATMFAQFSGNARFGGQRGQFMGHMDAKGQNMVTGSIVNKDNNSITVKLPDGSSKIVILSGSTSINKQATGSASDLKSGDTVAIFGSTNSDGSVTAQNIQLNPQMHKMNGGSPAPTQ